ncbi:MAG: hypothetical protein AAF184_09410 [Pseudomonadota bacterium]
MGTFLMIVAAVVLVLAVGVGIALWFARRWLARKVGDWSVACELIDVTVNRPARLKLQPYAGSDPIADSGFEERNRALRSLGFRPLGDYESESYELPILRAMHHPEKGIGAALILHEGGCHLECFAVTTDDRVLAIGSGPTPAAQSERLRWTVLPTLTPEQALTHLEDAMADTTPRAMDARLFRAAYEQAYAARMDGLLARAPSRDALEKRGRERRPPATAAQIELAANSQHSAWLDQVEEAALDRYRRASRLDAVTWERIGDDLHVVHDRLPEDRLHDMLVMDDASELVFSQCLAQELRGKRLYEEVLKRLPATSRRRQRLSEVRYPLPAVIYGIDPELADEASPAQSYEYVYQAVDPERGDVRGKLMATSTVDAKRQLQQMGLMDSKIVVDPTIDGGQLQIDDADLDIYVESMTGSWWQNLIMMIKGNWLLWLPPLLLVAWVLSDGPPYGWGDYAAFTYLSLAVLGVAYHLLPALAYDGLVRARNGGRWRAASMLLRICQSRAGTLDAFYRHQLELEHGKILAGQGNLGAALAHWKTFEDHVSAADYVNGLTALYSAAGDWPRVIEAQRRAIALAPDPAPMRVDLAMSLARYTDEVDEAETLLSGLHPDGLSELVLGGFMYARGLIALKRGQLQIAERQLAQTIEQVKQYEAGPAVAPWGTEVRAFLALTWKRAGKLDAASSLWTAIEARLRHNPIATRLAQEYRAATPEQGAA